MENQPSLRAKLHQLRQTSSDPCISILLNTHRTFPDNKQDEIVLKNLVQEAETRLLTTYEKRDILPVIEKMKQLAASVDHRYNLDSLGLFVSRDTAEFLRLPVSVTDRVNIGPNFAVREIVRAINQTERYYLLVVSQQKARLLEAKNDQLTREITDDDFPMTNDNLYSTHALDRSLAGVEENYLREFFNRVDKAFVEVYRANPLPTILAADQQNHSHYRQISDIPDAIVAYLSGNRDNDKPHELIADAWPAMRAHNARQQDEALQQLDLAQSHQKALSDLQDIFLAARDGRAELLLVEKGFLQPAVVIGDSVKIVTNANAPGASEDIIDDIIEMTMDNGGKVVYLDPGQLTDYQKLALVVRY
ncbi:MAG: hypothetical protein EPGJADBJ_00784 [Saprospiraceae bacterium]|nr:hypothetical protein [Saprospiraceae bacterium]